MQNLDQIRAADALVAAKDLKRSAFSKIPVLIINNGLLSAASYCNAEGGGKNSDDLKKAMEATTRYLESRGIVESNSGNIADLVLNLSNETSFHLQYATSEALAYLSYLKRFATND